MRHLKNVVHTIGFGLLVYFLGMIFLGRLTEPVEYWIKHSGEYAIWFLLASLAVTPVRLLFQWKVQAFRRVLGLWSFFWAIVHVGGYLTFDQAWDISDIINDALKRPYILVGWCSFVLITFLGVTSFSYFIKKVGKHWTRIHQLVYLLGILVVGHVLLLKSSKHLWADPLTYGIIFIILMFVRWLFNAKPFKK